MDGGVQPRRQTACLRHQATKSCFGTSIAAKHKRFAAARILSPTWPSTRAANISPGHRGTDASPCRNWQTSKTQSFQAQPGGVWRSPLAATARYLASSGDEGHIVVRRTDDWGEQETIETGDVDVISIAFDGTGKKIAAASLAGPVEIWALGPGAGADPVARVPARTEKRWKVRYSPDGSTLAIASWDGTVGFWDAETLQYRGTIDGNDERVNDIAFAFVDGKRRLLTATESGVVRFWDSRPSGQSSPTQRMTAGRRSSAATAADGTKFAAGGKDGLATLYRVDENGSLPAAVCDVKHDKWVTSVAFSPDGSRVLSGDRSENGVKLWETDTCQEVGIEIPAEGTAFRAVAFSPTGDQIAWSAKAGDIWLMRLDTMPLRRQSCLALHTKEVGRN